MAQKVSITVPAGDKITVGLKQELDTDLVKIGLTAFLGALSFVGTLQGEEQRDLLLKFLAGLITSSEALIRTAKLNAILEEGASDPSIIVENFLKSLDEHT